MNPVFSSLFILFLLPFRALAEPLLAGVATEDITPPVGFPMWGYGARHDAPSDGVLDPLHAKAVVLQAGTQKLAIVGLDMGRAPSRRSMETIRKAAMDGAGVQTLMIVGSHTHHGPVIETENWPSSEHPYVRDMEAKIVRAILEAAEKAVPVRMGLAKREVPLNRNRHWKKPNPPVDRELSVIRLDTLDGKPLATLVNFAAHPVTTPAEVLKFSADYPGVMMNAVQETFVGTCVFLQGAAGDMSVNPPSPDGRTPQAFGNALAAEVISLAKTIETKPWEDAKILSREDEFQFRSRVDLSSPIVRELFVRAFYKDLVDASMEELAPGIRPHLTTVLLQNGEEQIALAGVSAEFFCDHAIQLKRRSPVPTLVFGYCNGHHLYFPTIESAAQGGYGGSPDVAPVEVGAGEQVMNRALTRIFEMQGKF